jgi:hypothetical protein
MSNVNLFLETTTPIRSKCRSFGRPNVTDEEPKFNMAGRAKDAFSLA